MDKDIDELSFDEDAKFFIPTQVLLSSSRSVGTRNDMVLFFLAP